MKKLFALLGAGLMLSACFDDGNPQTGGNLKNPPKLKEASSASQSVASTAEKAEVQSEKALSPADKTESTPAVTQNVVKETETKVTESKTTTSVKETTLPAKSETEPKVSAQSNPKIAEKMKHNESDHNERDVIKSENKNKNRKKIEVKKLSSEEAYQENSREESLKEKAKQATSELTKKHLAYNMISKHKSKDEGVSNFSMEELRLGAQRILTVDEIRYEKSQCRYPYMSPEETERYKCTAKRIAKQ